MESWRDVPGYEGLYQASDKGNIKSLGRTTVGETGKKYTVKEKILKKIMSSNGYYYVNLRKNGKSRPSLIHRLVAESFLGVPDSKKVTNHKDGNKLNNEINNLEFVTYQENLEHAYSNGLNDLTAEQFILMDKETFEIHYFRSARQCALFLGKSHNYWGNRSKEKFKIKHKKYLIKVLGKRQK